MQAKKREERRKKMVWQNAMYDASLQNGSLRVTSTKLDEIDPMLFEYQSNFGQPLTTIRLVGIELNEVPSEIGSKLISLEVISLANNNLIQLPDSFVNLTNLKELYLMYNKLNKLPERIGFMCSLQKIGFSNNCLNSLPITFGALNNLMKVDLECNSLTVLPENLDNMVLCNALNLNNNKLVRLPRCLARMPSLTSLSASKNQIAYIPTELCNSKTLEIIRLNNNKINAIPERIGDLQTLKELAVDYNNIARLPMSFYKLTNVKIIRLEGNMAMIDPPPEVIVRGGEAIIQYCRDCFINDKQSRMRHIILTTQALLLQIEARMIADTSLFEPNILLKANDFDSWIAIDIPYLFSELIPQLQGIWHLELTNQYTTITGVHNKRLKDLGGANITSFSYNEREVLWAFSNYSDAYGPVLKKQKVNFLKCNCCDENGNRTPCVPPRVGYMCCRESVLLKSYLVRLRDKEDRLWQAYKANGLDDAVKRAESEAKIYLDSMEGKDWLEAVAYEQAEEMLMDQGATHAVKARQSNVEKRKSKIIARFEGKKRGIQKVRDGKMSVLQVELNKYKEDRKVVKEGYMRNAIEARINDLTTRMANLPETIELQMLQDECEQECKMVEDALFDNDSDDSMNPSEAEHSDLYSSEDSSAEAQRFRYRLKRFRDKATEKERLQKIQERFKQEAPPLTGAVALAANAVKKAVIKPFITPVVDGISNTVHRTHKGFKRSVRHIREVAAMRTRKLFSTVNGTFDEIQKELKYEIYYQYINHQIALAREKARHEFSVIDTVRQNVQGTGKENAFKAWVKWVYTKKQRIRRDIRSNWKARTKGFDAAMVSVTSAQELVNMWLKQYDIYSDRPFWRHSIYGDVTFDKPGIQHYLPASFEIPTPPEALPEGITIDTSSDESESNWQRRRDAERIRRAEAKKLQQMNQQLTAAISSDSESAEESIEEKPKPRRRRNASSSSSSSSGSESKSRISKSSSKVSGNSRKQFTQPGSRGSQQGDLSHKGSSASVVATQHIPRLPAQSSVTSEKSSMKSGESRETKESGTMKHKSGLYDVHREGEDDPAHQHIFGSSGATQTVGAVQSQNIVVNSHSNATERVINQELIPLSNKALVIRNDDVSLSTELSESTYQDDLNQPDDASQQGGSNRLIKSMTVDQTTHYSTEYIDALYNAENVPSFNAVYNEADAAYDYAADPNNRANSDVFSIASSTNSNNTFNIMSKTQQNMENYNVIPNSATSQKLLDAVAKARHYMNTSEFYKTRKNITLPDVDKSDLNHVADGVALRAHCEFETASKNIRKKRNQLNPVRHHTYITQANRKARSFEQIKADQAKSEEALLKENLVEVAEGIFIDMRSVDAFKPPTEDELLKLAGGDLSMIQATGKAGQELRTILAQRALHVRKRIKEKAIERGILPPQPTFYKREILPFFSGHYHGSSSDEEEDEEEIKRLKEERKQKRREERAERNAMAARIEKAHGGDNGDEQQQDGGGEEIVTNESNMLTITEG